MKNNPARVLMVLALCGFGLLSLGCPQKAVRVAAVLPMTGDNDIYGEPVRKGIELAYAELQADTSSGVLIELEIVDSESNPEKAKELLSQEYGAGAILAIGGVTSAEAKEMVAVAERFDRVLLSPTASAPELSGISRNFYRIWPSDHAAAGRMAQFISQDLKIEEVVVLAEEAQEYAKGIQGAFQSAYEGYGGKVVEVIGFPPNTVDFSGLVGRVSTLGPQAVYVTAYGEAIGALIQELRRIDYKGKILTTSAFASPRFIVPAGDAAAGVILTQSVFEPDSEHAHVRSFVDAFKAKFDGEEPDIFAAHGYDALNVVIEALKDRSPLPSEVPKGLSNIEAFPGVTGSIQFNQKGDVQKYPRVYIISKDLLLNDYGERVRQQQDEIRKRREELKAKLDAINRRAKQMGN